jgi:hypothetical protein
MFIRGSKKDCFIMGLHVDDFAIAGMLHSIQEFKDQFKERFLVKEIGFAKFIVDCKSTSHSMESVCHSLLTLKTL